MGLGSSKSKPAAGARALSSKSVRKAIRNKQLAPILEGQDDPAGTLDECPICLLHYPAVNTAACCGNALCTECYVQVALSRSQHEAQPCPFCNKAGYRVTFRTKTPAQRAAERSECASVEQAVLRAREEEERRSQHLRRKHASESSDLPMTPEQGSLAEEWARAQEEDRRYMDTRQERWRESLARAAAANDAGAEADDTDVEELMIMQALLLSLDEQHGSSADSGDAGGPSGEGGPSGTADTGGPSGESGPSGAADTGNTDSGGGVASRPAHGAEAFQQDISSSSSADSTDAAGDVPASDVAPEAADVPDAELLAHAARLAERAAAVPSAQPALQGGDGTSVEATTSSSDDSAAAASQASVPPAPAEWNSRDATVAYVQSALPTADDSSPTFASDAADPDLRDMAEARTAQAASAVGSPALAAALAEVNGWPAPLPADRPAAAYQAGSAPSRTGQEFTASPAAGIGSPALAHALATANGWPLADAPDSCSERAAQAAATQPAPPFVGMVTVHTAAHVLPPRSPPSLLPELPAAGDRAPLEPHRPAAAAKMAQAKPGGSSGGRSSGDQDDSAEQWAGEQQAGVAAVLGEAGGAALLLQPDGSSALVLLTGSLPKPAAAATATTTGVAAAGVPAAVGPDFAAIPMYELDAQDAADRQLAAALAAADAALMQHTHAALQQQTLATQQADEQYRIALDVYAARDEAMQRAIRESDERLKALYSNL